MTSAKAKLIRGGGDENAPPLVFIHGFGADHMTWAYMAPNFIYSHNVWTLDLPGHGSADNEVGDVTVEGLAESVWQALQEKVSTPVTLVGHSLGGAIAMELQQRYAADIRQLVLLAPAGLVPVQNAHLITRLPNLRTAEAAEQHLLDLVAVKRLITPPIVDYLLMSLSSEQRRAALKEVADALMARQKLVSSVPQNTLLIWGEADMIFPPAMLDERSLGANVHLLPGIGHLLQAEAAQKVARIISENLGVDET